MFVIKNEDSGLFLTKSDIFGDDGWAWCQVIVDGNPEYAPYIFSDMYEALEILNKYANNSNSVIKEIHL